MNFGPQHPAAHGVMRLVLEMDGEIVERADPHIGLLHRGTEKLIEYKTYLQAIPYFDRLDYVSPMCQEHAFALAVEKLMGITPPPRAQYIRVLFAEITRILNHLLCIMRIRPRCRRDHAVPVGLRGARTADGVLRAGVGRAPARQLFPSRRRPSRPAGRPRRRHPARSARPFPKTHRRYRAAADREPHLQGAHRRYRRGQRAEDAADWGFSGPMLRGSGVAWDLRRAQPYDVYDKMDFDIPIGKNGDCLRPLPGADRGDAPVGAHHRAGAGPDAGRARSRSTTARWRRRRAPR